MIKKKLIAKSVALASHAKYYRSEPGLHSLLLFTSTVTPCITISVHSLILSNDFRHRPFAHGDRHIKM